VHTDDGARHQGQNGYCTVINDLFTYFRSTQSKVRQLSTAVAWAASDFVLNEYSRSYLIAQQLPQTHLAKLQFSSASLGQSEAEWQAYLQGLGITSLQG